MTLDVIFVSVNLTNLEKEKFRYRDSNPGILRERQVC